MHDTPGHSRAAWQRGDTRQHPARAGALHSAPHLRLVSLHECNDARPQQRRPDARPDLGLAHELQLRLLPELSTPHEGLRIAGAYQPAFEVGGDFYQIVEHEPHRIGVIIGDVSGKGVAAAMIMSRIMADISRIARRTSTPDKVLNELNQNMCELDFLERFITATSLELDVRHHRLSVANAGHLPAVVRTHNGEVSLFGRPSGAALGLVAGERYTTECRDYNALDIVLLVTDGVTEALEPNADPDGGVLMQLVADCPPDIDAVTHAILAAVRRSNARLPDDDVAVLALQLR